MGKQDLEELISMVKKEIEAKQSCGDHEKLHKLEEELYLLERLRRNERNGLRIALERWKL